MLVGWGSEPRFCSFVVSHEMFKPSGAEAALKQTGTLNMHIRQFSTNKPTYLLTLHNTATLLSSPMLSIHCFHLSLPRIFNPGPYYTLSQNKCRPFHVRDNLVRHYPILLNFGRNVLEGICNKTSHLVCACQKLALSDNAW